MRVFHRPEYVADIGDHVMPIHKFDLVRQRIEALGLDVCIEAPEPVSDDDLLRVHDAAYVRAVMTGEPRALAESQKFPWSPRLAQAVRYTSGGCIAALEAALDDGVAANLASGFHHAHADHGEGFCTFNGLVIALERAVARGAITRGLVIDLDLHYGNGTAALLAGRPHLFNLSVYGNYYRDNRAYRDVTVARTPDSDNCWSVPVPAGADGSAYLALVAPAVEGAIARAEPDVILYQAGADPFRDDPYSPLDLGHDDLRERDRRVLAAARAAGIPIAWVLAGGYTEDVSQVVEVHVNTLRATFDVFFS